KKEAPQGASFFVCVLLLAQVLSVSVTCAFLHLGSLQTSVNIILYFLHPQVWRLAFVFQAPVTLTLNTCASY
ncbi:MAG TPA: hypothetical protein VK927_06755, partial [Adhaeribacter sp.]|nr:hypothetical protein [Adhaeribacter sp.]